MGLFSSLDSWIICFRNFNNSFNNNYNCKHIKMKIKNQHIEFWGRAILVASILSLMVEWNNSFVKWFIWSILAIVLFLYACNLKKEEKNK